MQIELPGAEVDIYESASKLGEIVGDIYKKRISIMALPCRTYNTTLCVQRKKAHPAPKYLTTTIKKIINTAQTKTQTHKALNVKPWQPQFLIP